MIVVGKVLTTIIAIVLMIVMLLFIWACMVLKEYWDNYYEYEESQEVEDMEVKEALQLVIKALEDNASCGRLGEKLRVAKITLKTYVEKKLVEDSEKAEE